MTGPNSRPTAPLPSRWSTNSRTIIVAVIGTTNVASDGWIVSIPSTADSTDIAGVIMLSPKNSAAPKMPTDPSTPNAFVDSRLSPSNASRASRPPSPSLSVRMNVSTYISVTITVMAQNTSEIAP